MRSTKTHDITHPNTISLQTTTTLHLYRPPSNNTYIDRIATHTHDGFVLSHPHDIQSYAFPSAIITEAAPTTGLPGSDPLPFLFELNWLSQILHLPENIQRP